MLNPYEPIKNYPEPKPKIDVYPAIAGICLLLLCFGITLDALKIVIIESPIYTFEYPVMTILVLVSFYFIGFYSGNVFAKRKG